MLMYQKSMFDRYDCIKSFSHSKSLEKKPRNVFFFFFFFFFLCSYICSERHVTCERFKNAASRSKTNVMLTSIRRHYRYRKIDHFEAFSPKFSSVKMFLSLGQQGRRSMIFSIARQRNKLRFLILPSQSTSCFFFFFFYATNWKIWAIIFLKFFQGFCSIFCLK